MNSCNTGDTGSIPGPERHPMEQVSLSATTTEPVLHKRNHRSEKPVHKHHGGPPLAATGEMLSTATKLQHGQRFKKKKNSEWRGGSKKVLESWLCPVSLI